MDSFTINGTEFGIDREESRLSLVPIQRGKREIRLSIRGDHRTYEVATEAEDSEWSWTLYPPHFYLYSFPVPSENPFSIRLTEEDCEEYDIALYMMEHNLVADVTVSVSVGLQVEVHGNVELSGEITEFAIRWDVEAGA